MSVIKLFTECILTSYNLPPVTDILTVSQGSTENIRAQLACNALRCLTSDEISLAKQCHTIIKNLREDRNHQQHPRPSKDHSLRLLDKNKGGFSPEDVATFQACIGTSRRLPSTGENNQSDLDLFGAVPDVHTKKLEEKLRSLRERRAALEQDTRGHGSASKSSPMKRNRPKDDNYKEDSDGDGHLTKKSKASAGS